MKKKEPVRLALEKKKKDEALYTINSLINPDSFQILGLKKKKGETNGEFFFGGKFFLWSLARYGLDSSFK